MPISRIPSPCFFRRAFLLCVVLLVLLKSSTAYAEITQPYKETISGREPVHTGQWDQTLGTGLSGTLTKASFPISFAASAYYGPNFLLTLKDCRVENYDCSVRVWGFMHASRSVTGPADVPVDTTLTFDTGTDAVFDPLRYYTVSLGITANIGGGYMLPYGSVSDAYAFGSTNDPVIKDLSFTLEGISRTVQTVLPSSISTTTPATTTPVVSSTTPTLPVATTTPAVSNVLFLPGIKGSMLFKPSLLCNLIAIPCDDTVWLPSSAAEVSTLFLNESGKSLNNDIYTKEGELLYGALGASFYRSFADTLTTAQRLGTLGNGWRWQAGAYDWRLSSYDIRRTGTYANGAITYGDADASNPYLTETIRSLAANSPTGKVTIVAHSYGGIVAQALVRGLGSVASNLVDRIILVGVPEQGAPRAVGAMLFGDGEGIPGTPPLPDFVMTPGLARALSTHSPAAYELLPRTSVAGDTPFASPIIVFASSTLLTQERIQYGSSIETPNELRFYLTNATGIRSRPSMFDTARPETLLSGLHTNADQAFDERVAQSLPSSIALDYIAGANKETISGIEMYERPRSFFGIPRSPTLAYRPLFNGDGDGTVPYASAAGTSRTSAEPARFSVNLSQTRDGTRTFSHGTLLESPQVQALILARLTGSTVVPSAIQRTTQMVASTNESSRVRFYVHSPASLRVTNSTGQITGINSAGSRIEEIPDSQYGELGDMVYVSAPSEDSYTVTLMGTEPGTVVFDTEYSRSGSTTMTTFADVLVTRGTVLTLSVENGIPSSLMIDENGDTNIERTIAPIVGSIAYYTPSSQPATPTPIVATSSPVVSPPSVQTTRITSSAARGSESVPHIDELPRDTSTTTPVMPSTMIAKPLFLPIQNQEETKEPLGQVAGEYQATDTNAVQKEHGIPYHDQKATSSVMHWILILSMMLGATALVWLVWILYAKKPARNGADEHGKRLREE